MGKAKLIYLFFLILTLGFAVVSGGYRAFMVFFMTALVYILMFFYVRYCAKNIEVAMDSKSSGYGKKEDIPFHIAVMNKCLLPIARVEVKLEYRNRFASHTHSKWVITTAPAMKKQTVTVALRSNYCGVMEVALKGIKIVDPLLLFSKTIAVGCTCSVQVFPNLIPVEAAPYERQMESSCEQLTSVFAKSVSDDPEGLDVRNYRPGDRLSRIHWKISSKIGSLMTKEFQDSAVVGPVILVDLAMPPKTKDLLKGTDDLLEQAYSLVKMFLSKGIATALFWYDFRNNSLGKANVVDEAQLSAAMAEIMLLTPYCGRAVGAEEFRKASGFAGNQAICLTGAKV